VLDLDPGDLRAEAASVDVEAVIVARKNADFVGHTGPRQGLVQQLRMRHRNEAIAGANGRDGGRRLRGDTGQRSGKSSEGCR
jgi:hypothetical protein